MSTAAVVAELEARVLASEMRRRIGRAVAVDPPPGAPPLVDLAHRVHPRWALERRARFLCLVGWLPAPLASCAPWDHPWLPANARVGDHLAVLVHAETVDTDDPVVQRLAASLRDGTDPEGSGEAWDRAFDAAADRVDPGWRAAAVPPPSPLARLETVIAEHDRFFGRRPPSSLWPMAREALRWVGEAKRSLTR